MKIFRKTGNATTHVQLSGESNWDRRMTGWTISVCKYVISGMGRATSMVHINEEKGREGGRERICSSFRDKVPRNLKSLSGEIMDPFQTACLGY